MDVIFNINKKYYIGRRLDIGKPIGKSKLINVVKGSKKSPCRVSKTSKTEENWGYTWGGASLTDKDWEYINAIVKEIGAKTVLEIGSGYSTLLFKSIGLDVLSFETRQADIDKLKTIDPELDIGIWDGKILPNFPSKFDLVFLDGPGGGENRGPAFEQVRKYSDNILVHDAGRVPEKKWAKMYFEEDALMYAAIFADKEVYECQVKRLMQRVNQLSLLYKDKATFVSQVGCDSNLNLLTLSNIANSFSSSSDLSSMSSIVEDIKDKNDYGDCRLW